MTIQRELVALFTGESRGSSRARVAQAAFALIVTVVSALLEDDDDEDEDDDYD